MLNGTTAQLVMLINARAKLLEVFVDKGTVMVFFIRLTDKVTVCYPNGGAYHVWPTPSHFTGLSWIACCIDCQSAVYFAFSQNISRLNSTGYSTVVSDANSVLCLAGDSDWDT